jgi:large subunit ribosomal protein L21
MFAIVSIAGQQFKVEEGQEIFVHQLEAEQGDQLTFDQVHLIEKEGNVAIGTPILNAQVGATVLGHQKGDKVIVFKKKRRKGYRVKNGHRQRFTKIKIDSIAG